MASAQTGRVDRDASGINQPSDFRSVPRSPATFDGFRHHRNDLNDRLSPQQLDRLSIVAGHRPGFDGGSISSIPGLGSLISRPSWMKGTP